jgi:dTDP-4-dehydrorhamnose 3,5-epimerase
VKLTPTRLPGVIIVEHARHSDERGFLMELFNEPELARCGLPIAIRQVNHSRSARGVLRGLHFQQPHSQGKLITVTRGEIFDVAVDVRRGSPAFGQWAGVRLGEGDCRSLWIPPGFAHGFCALSETADVIYGVTQPYDEPSEHGVLWSDPGLAIDWPLEQPLLSAKDSQLPPLHPDRSDLPRYER